VRKLKEKTFALKADINKAFDTLEWTFIEQALQRINMPHRLIKLIMSSLDQSKLTVLNNGHNDGFIKPTRRL
jgi:Reverse transcriptase (RNA-dependent DNA polymerase)